MASRPAARGDLLVIACQLPTTPLDRVALIEATAGLLSAAERDRAHALAPVMRRRFVLARGLLRTCAARLLACPPAALAIDYDAAGKPRFGGAAGELAFNWSHSDEWLLVALSRAGAVGVDVESELRRNRLEAIANRYFRPRECKALAELPDDAARRHRFFVLWTLKEAYAKALGCGLAPALSGMDFTIAPEPQPAILHTTGAARTSATVSGWQWRLTETQLGALFFLGDPVVEGPAIYRAKITAKGELHCQPWAPPELRRVIASASSLADIGNAFT